MSSTIAPPASPFPARPAPAAEPTSSSSSSPPPSASAGPIGAKPMPVELPLTSFASTPHNVACIAFVLGACWATGLALSLPNLPGWFVWTSPAAASAAALPQQGWWTALTRSPQLGWYISSWAVFHLLEFVVTSMYNPGKLSVSSYLLDNGNAYHVAHIAGILENILEERYFPEQYRLWKHSGVVFVLGLAVVGAGQILRSFAMISASSNFSHLLAYSKRPDHELVKTGIYSWSRHPSYAGFYWWAVGTQIVLGNPICTIVFVGVLQWFFSERIKVEEKYLVKFFGKEYEDYRSEVPTRILLIP
ncbi:hypothetical protein JCM10213_008769 [Rhodosporidiobolus nylandii]